MKRKTVDDDEWSDEDSIEDDSFDLIEVKRQKPNDKDSQIQWIEKYIPKTSKDVSINPTKLRQIKQEMINMVERKGPKILVVTGPSGSCKSTTVKVLSEELTNGVIEYNNSMVISDFFQDCKYLVGKNQKVVLIEELPNIYYKPTHQKFQQEILNWIYSPQELPPVIICLTEIETNFTDNNFEFFNIENNLNVNTLLGKQILSNDQVNVIKFNSIAHKFMSGCLNKIINNERIFKIIPKTQIETFIKVMTEVGDLRSAIHNLEIWAKFYCRGIDLSKDLNRNTTLNLFHIIGKIIYSSTKFNNLLTKDEINYLTVEEVLNNYENFNVLNVTILENYLNLLSQSDIDLAGNIADNLSQSDLIYSFDEGKDYMVRSTRTLLGERKGFNKMTFSKNFSAMKNANKINSRLKELKELSYFKQTSLTDLNLLQGYYVPIILNKRTKLDYGRIGGRFNSYIDDNMYDADAVDEDKGNNNNITDQFDVDLSREKQNSRDINDIDSTDEMSDPISDSEQDFDDELDDELFQL